MTDLLATTIPGLKSADPDRYRSALLADVGGRQDLMILYGFHYELAKVPDVTSEPMLGAIRYQWWRDALDEIYSGKQVRRHEVSSALADLIDRRNLSRFHLDQLIDGRARDLDPTPFKDIEDARNYCRQTSGVLSQLAVNSLGGKSNEYVIKAGEAWGMMGLARAYSDQHNRVLSELSFETLLDSAQKSYEEVKQSISKLETKITPALAYVSLVGGFLKRMRKPNFDPLKMRVEYGPLSKQLRLFRAGLSGRL